MDGGGRCVALRGSVHVCKWGERGEASLVGRLARYGLIAEGTGASSRPDEDELPHCDSDVSLADLTMPFGELRLGTHPRDPALITVPAPTGQLSTTLGNYLKHYPQLVGSRGKAEALPFVLKVISAARPTPLKVRPTVAGARATHTHPDIYARPSDQSEVLVAVSECQLLCGFAPVETILDRFGASPELVCALHGCTEALRAHEVVSDVVRPALRALAGTILRASSAAIATALEQLRASLAASTEGGAPHHEVLCARLHAAYPNDPACLLPLFLAFDRLALGQALAIASAAWATWLPLDVKVFIELLSCAPTQPEPLTPLTAAEPCTTTFIAVPAGGRAEFTLSCCTLPPAGSCILAAVGAPALLLVCSGGGTLEECAGAPFSLCNSRAVRAGLALLVPAETDLRLTSDAEGGLVAFHAAAAEASGGLHLSSPGAARMDGVRASHNVALLLRDSPWSEAAGQAVQALAELLSSLKVEEGSRQATSLVRAVGEAELVPALVGYARGAHGLGEAWLPFVYVALSILTNTADADGFKGGFDKVREGGGIDLLLELLASADARVRYYAVVGVQNLLRDERAARQVLEAGALELLATLLAEDGADKTDGMLAAIVEAAAGALNNFNALPKAMRDTHVSSASLTEAMEEATQRVAERGEPKGVRA
ncbi:RmlC-like cupin domain-containing protein [Pavlovales sp. CCMP2436]|nr:RmlC-like cupin domain-containing protein [Pavlovales sp. CCMP2436]